jgi:bifunctional DNA-binding transcriptional regulator/antitoxin component of YhaV-PrlF toxin-antitoxin module
MDAVTFASKLRDDGSVAIPKEAVEELGLHPGDELTVRVEPANGTDAIDEQAALQAKFDRFFEKLDTLTFEKVNIDSTLSE